MDKILLIVIAVIGVIYIWNRGEKLSLCCNAPVKDDPMGRGREFCSLCDKQITKYAKR